MASVAIPRHRVHARARGLTGFDLAALFTGNLVLVAGLWWRGGELSNLHQIGGVLTSGGRLAGLLGAYLILVQVLLLARIPALERAVGFERLTFWHRVNGRTALGLLIAHAALISIGYALTDRLSLPREVWSLLTTFPGVLTATAGLLALSGVVVASVVIVRRRLRYETWYFVHLYSYLGIALAFSHQIATGHDFAGNPVAQVYWKSLYAGSLAALVVFRVAAPIARGFYHRLQVIDVIAEGPGVVTLWIGGRRLDRLAARSGQFFLFRFLTRDRWWEAHPYSLSCAPDGRHLRITVKALGDFSASLARVRPGTRVLAEGPFGSFTAAARRRRRALLIAGGVGITPIRALLQDMPGGPGDMTVVYRAVGERDVIFREELDELASRRGAELHYVLGDHRDPAARELLGPAHLRHLVPDLRARDVFVCGPPAMADAVRRTLRRAGVPRRQVICEGFGY
ncbi:ferredoxin reductase family protein [Candidatus Solirubrobacter pratensis]|uniref:ferredoxin reductase family protein n=1 Tax=Candidatus Solirubrobacter pratensis TaxID=1298857 RepID=UPI0004894E54|nr:ferredoxin reductase family protein [Candidatus Solirubrobacter pratensis]